MASLFAGIGGICLGFMQAGCDIVWANEIDFDAVKTYKQNFGDKFIVQGDIRKISAVSLPDFEILTAGFPCQPFSIRGYGLGFKDPRGNLFFEITKILDKKRPLVVFLENVKNLIEHDDGKTFLVIYNALAQFGYYVKYQVLDAFRHAGIPQKRERVFLVAFQNYNACQKFSFPEEVNFSKRLNNFIDRELRQEESFYYKKNNDLYNDLQSKVCDSDALYLITDKGVSTKPYYIASTLKANMGTFKDRVPVLKDRFGIRKLTPMECLSLQGFPGDYSFSPDIKIESKYKQAGNTVCVPVIQSIAKKIIEALNE